MTQTDGEDRRAAGREMDDCTAQGFLRDIHARISLHNARLERDRRASKTSVDGRAGLVLSVFRDLWRIGYSVGKVANLRREHCERVLREWQGCGVARATASKRWVALEVFSQALGKARMVPSLETLWPGEPGHGAPGRRRVTVTVMPHAQYEELLAKFGVADVMYWVLSLECEVGLARDEALMANLVVGFERGDQTLSVSRAGRQQARPVAVDTLAKRGVVSAARNFVYQRGRETLCRRGVSAAAAVKRVSNAGRY